MTHLVFGATGATGRLLVRELLNRGESVRTIVRSRARLVDVVGEHRNLNVVEATLLDMSEQQLTECVAGCAGVASCLGHNLTMRGVFGPPRRLVTEAVRRVCGAIHALEHEHPVRLALMSSAGVRNQSLSEPISIAQQAAIGLIRTFIPPHADNEAAADWLRTKVGPSDPTVEWVVVRPDSLIDAPTATAYHAHPSPTRNAIFNPGKTSRANVAHFMAELLTNPAAWSEWRGQMPVLYNEPPQ